MSVRERRSQISDIKFYLMKLEKDDQIKPKARSNYYKDISRNQ